MKNQIIKIIFLLCVSSFVTGCDNDQELPSEEVNGPIAVTLNAITEISYEHKKVNALRLDNVNIPLSYGKEKIDCIYNVTPPPASLENNRVYAYVTYSGYDINFQYYTKEAKCAFSLKDLKPGCNTLKVDLGTGACVFNVFVMP